MLTIKDHLIVEAKPVFAEISNHGGALIDPPFLVLHYTAGTKASQTISSFSNPTRQASAHLVIDRDGSITQCVKFDVVAWHAGESKWSVPRTGLGGLVLAQKTYTGLNRYSIGIEIVNAGFLTRRSNDYYTWIGEKIDPSDVIEVDPKEPESFGKRYWHAFESAQIATCVAVAEILWTAYPLKDIIRHSDIAPGRKVDPGPAFPYAQMRSKILGRNDK